MGMHRVSWSLTGFIWDFVLEIGGVNYTNLYIAIHLCILGMVQPVAGKRLPREGEDCEIKRPFVDSLSQPRIRVFVSNLGLLGNSKKSTFDFGHFLRSIQGPAVLEARHWSSHRPEVKFAQLQPQNEWIHHISPRFRFGD